MNKNKTTIVADNEVLVQLRGLAQRQGVSFSEIVRCALKDYIAKHSSRREGRFHCLGAGNSGGLNLSERAEELLFQEPRRRKR